MGDVWKVVFESDIAGEEVETLGEFETWKEARDFYIEISQWWIALEKATPYKVFNTEEILYGCDDCVRIVENDIMRVLGLQPNSEWDEGNFNGNSMWLVPSTWSYEEYLNG